MIINARRITDAAILPNKAYSTDAGLDLYAAEDIDINPHKTVLVSTGIALEIPEGHAGLIWDRSSMGVKGVHRFGGVIDSGYRGEIKVCLANLGYGLHDWPYHHASYKIEQGDKIAQLIIHQIPDVQIVESDVLTTSSRDTGGFGSSGK
jgi:dUTP pyrophosphatase